MVDFLSTNAVAVKLHLIIFMVIGLLLFLAFKFNKC